MMPRKVIAARQPSPIARCPRCHAKRLRMSVGQQTVLIRCDDCLGVISMHGVVIEPITWYGCSGDEPDLDIEALGL